jgi:hypothetical protein
MCARGQASTKNINDYRYRMLFPRGSREKYMAFFWTSIDESSDRTQEYAFVVAGLVSRQDYWFEIERQWDRTLKRHSLEYFKTSEYLGLNGQFKRFRDKGEYPKPSGRDAAREIVDELELIIRSSRVKGIGLAIDLQDYRAARKSSRIRKVFPSDPYRFGYQMLMVYIAGEVTRGVGMPTIVRHEGAKEDT